MNDPGGDLGEAHLHSAEELPWVDHEEVGKWFVKVGDDFRWYLNSDGQVQLGAFWFDDRTAAQQAMDRYNAK